MYDGIGGGEINQVVRSSMVFIRPLNTTTTTTLSIDLTDDVNGLTMGELSIPKMFGGMRKNDAYTIQDSPEITVDPEDLKALLEMGVDEHAAEITIPNN